MSTILKNQIIKYSANYSHCNHNFCFLNLNLDPKKTRYTPTIRIIKNILQRGKPTSMSSFLQDSLSSVQKDKEFTTPIALIGKEPPIWIRTIKGDNERNYFPAKTFFDNIPKYFPEHPYIQQLICPEVLINDITQLKVDTFKGEIVDFYLPQAFLVIEIDGGQHAKQVSKDKERDTFLKKQGVATFRIKTNDLNSENDEFKIVVKNIKIRLEKAINGIDRKERNDSWSLNGERDGGINLSIADYKKSYYSKKDYYQNNFCKATAIIRFQLLILDLLENKTLTFKKDWFFEISENDISDFAKLAIEDLFVWLEQILSLQKIGFTKPKYSIESINNIEDFSTNKNAIQIDFSLLKRYTDEVADHPSIIFVRNDYFDEYRTYVEEDTSKTPRFEIKPLDHFSMATHSLEDIKYKIQTKKNSKDIQTLENLAWDLFLQHNLNASKKENGFRPGQIGIIKNALERNDTLGLLPTGSGKSICYQLVAFLQPAISFVVPPIKALMEDQKIELNNAFITRVETLNSDDSTSVKSRKVHDFSQGKFFFIFISPERFQNQQFRESFSALNIKKEIAYAVVDEVHCLSEWGHDFRLSYLSLARTIRNLTKNITFIGLTATASTKVIKDIQVEFDLIEDDIKTPGNFTREELNFIVKDDEHDKEKDLIKLLKNLQSEIGAIELKGNNTKAGIIFTRTVNGSKGCFHLKNLLTEEFNDKHIKFFSGTQPKKERISVKEFANYKKETLKKFKSNECSLIVATNAFGMGVNKGNVYYTIHYGIPGSMEALYQEGGRAGRDKTLFSDKPANCYIFISKNKSKNNNLWSEEVSIKDFKEKEVDGDLGTNLFFLKQNLTPPNEEAKKIRKVFDSIINSGLKVMKIRGDEYDFSTKQETENILYKLKQLGVIDDWTIEKWFKWGGFFNVTIIDASVKTIEKGLFSTIQKYDYNFNMDNISKDISYKTYKDILALNIDTIDKYIYILLEWSYKTFVYARKQSLKTVYENCVKLADKDITSKAFKDTLESYFKFNSTSHIYQKILDGEINLESCFDIFYQQNKILTQKTLESRRDNLSRYLESTNDNAGLNLISGLLRLLLDEFKNADGRIRLENALKKIFSESTNNQEIILEQVMNIGANCDDHNRSFLAEIMYTCSDGKMDLLRINKKLNDTFSRMQYLNIQNNRLTALNKVHYGRFRKIG